MKTLITLACIIGFGCMSFSHAAPYTANGKGDNALSRLINSRIHYPTIAGGNVEAIVTVNLTVREDGTLQINKISSTDERVVASIQNQLTQIRLKPGSEQTGKSYGYRFVLKVQQ